MSDMAISQQLTSSFPTELHPSTERLTCNGLRQTEVPGFVITKFPCGGWYPSPRTVIMLLETTFLLQVAEST